ncbi:hypothetical protein DMENIID0001_141600 [Sergentomyia squamirostris]
MGNNPSAESRRIMLKQPPPSELGANNKVAWEEWENAFQCTPLTPGKSLEPLPAVSVVIGKKEKQLTDAGNQSPLVRWRWRASRLSETSSEEEPVGRVTVRVAEEILLEESSPERLARAAEILEQALP